MKLAYLASCDSLTASTRRSYTRIVLQYKANAT